MMPLDCEIVRDMLPARQRGELPTHEAARIDGHLAACADCDVVAGIIGTLVRVPQPVPADLAPRVMAAVMAPKRPSIPAWAGIAATLAAALVGGWLVLQAAGEPETGAGNVALEEAAPLMSWTVADDPLLRGGNTLQQLSVEQLELVLAELDQ